MEAVRSERSAEKLPPLQGAVIQRTRIQVWFIRICSSILIWTCLVQLVAVGELWHPRLLTGYHPSGKMSQQPPPPPPSQYPLLPPISVALDLVWLLCAAFLWTDFFVGIYVLMTT